MHIERLWAPWRLGYIRAEAGGNPEPAIDPSAWRPGSDRGCFLCRAAAAAHEHARILGVLERTPLSIVVVNRYPYSNGHLLVSPLDHLASLDDLQPAQLLDLQERLAGWCRTMTRSLDARGFNVGLNLGSVAGAGVPGHLHWHLVPRWPGDVNFMPTVAGVRVLPQALDSLWAQLVDARSTEERAP